MNLGKQLTDSLLGLTLFVLGISPSIYAETALFQLLYQKDGGNFGSDRMGASVASAGDVNGDGKDDFIIGAPYASLHGPVAGSAYVYSGADGSLLFAKNGEAPYTLLGSSVASAEDVNADGKADFIIGAPTANGPGSAYVYSGADGALLFEKHGAGPHRLGVSVASAGDLNGDGKADFIVGAHLADGGGLDLAGSAYVYSGADGTLLFEKHGTAEGDEFGYSVASAGDVNGDGRPDFIVGARYTFPGGLGLAGTAYVYSGEDGSLLFEKNGPAGACMGYSVAGAGDVNGDGKADFIAGAPYPYEAGSHAAGSAFAYSGADGTLLFEKHGIENGDEFGISVASAGDVNGDGRSDFIVGAWGADFAKFADAGGAFVYSGADGTRLFMENGDGDGDLFGCSVASAGDVNGDGNAEVIIGSWGASYGSGSAYVYGPSPVPTDVSDSKNHRPARFELSQNYPNPFNPTTTIRYSLPRQARASLETFNLLGERVRMLLDEEQTAGAHTAVWDGKDGKGKILPSGIYFYRLKTKDYSETRKMMFLK